MPTVRAFVLVLLAVCPLTPSSKVMAQECPDGAWPTTTFEVRDYRAIPFREWRNAARRTPEMWAKVLEEFIEELPGQEPSTADRAWARLAERELGDIARRLQAAGFRCPRMRTVERDGSLRYVAYVIDFSGDPDRGYRKTEAGADEDYAERQKRLGLAYTSAEAPHFVINREAVGLQSELDRAASAGQQGQVPLHDVHVYRTLAHELFHLVQASYDRQFHSIAWATEGMGRDFVVEGSADGVARYLAAQRHPGSEDLETSQQALGGFPYFQSMLRAQRGSNWLNVYATSSFWLHLAERYGGLGAIERLLRHPIGAVRQDARLEWLDSGLLANPSVRRGLGAVFPQFIAEMASYGWSRYDAVEPDRWLNWTLASCLDGLDATPVRQLTPFAPETARRWTAEPLENICINASWESFPAALSPTILQVEVSAPDATSLDQAQVGLAAHGTDYCWPTRGSCLLDGDVTFQVGNRHHRTFNVSLDKSTGPSALIVVSNIARRDAPSTKAIEDVEVRVRLLWEEASMTSRGPSPADIDAPLPIELDFIAGGLVPTPSTVASQPTQCSFTFLGRNTVTKDAIGFQMVHAGPVGPGVYRISAADVPRHVPPEEAPGTFTGDWGLGKGHPLGGGRALAFFFLSGEVEITSVSGGLVQGEVRATGWRNRYNEPGAAASFEPFGPDRSSVVARFSFIPNKVLPPKAALQMARACLTSAPASTASGPSPSGQPPRSSGPAPQTPAPPARTPSAGEPAPSGQPEPSGQPPQTEPSPPPVRPSPEAPRRTATPPANRPATQPTGNASNAPRSATDAGRPATSQPSAASQAEEVADPEPAFSVNGTWSTRYGEMRLTQTKDVVAGTYEGGRSMVTGILRDRVFEGIWFKPRSGRACPTEREGTRYWGRLRFRFVNDTSFEGAWGYCGDEPTESWTGTRVEGGPGAE